MTSTPGLTPPPPPPSGAPAPAKKNKRVPTWLWIIGGVVALVLAVVLAPMVAAMALTVMITGIVALAKDTPTWLRFPSRRVAIIATVVSGLVFFGTGTISTVLYPSTASVGRNIEQTPAPTTTPASFFAPSKSTPTPTAVPTPTSTPTPEPTIEPAPVATPEPEPEPVAPAAPEPAAPAQPEPAPVEPAPVQVYYKNCTEVRAAGAAPIYQGQPGYASHLDRDGDGIACDI